MNEGILYAVYLCCGGYNYSVLIHDEALLRRLMREWPDPADVPEGERGRMRQLLKGKIPSDRSLHMMPSYFY